jgi:hypothetical protein
MKMPGRPILKSFTTSISVIVELMNATILNAHPNHSATAQSIQLAALQCPGATNDLELTVEPVLGIIQYRMGNTRGDLQRIASRHAGRSLPGNWYPLGMTQTESIIRYNANFTAQPLATGRYCAYPSSVTVHVGYPQFTVWVDRRYPKNSCEYQAILYHEHDHVRIYREQLQLHIDNIHRQIARVIRSQRPSFATSANAAIGRADRSLFQRIRPLTHKLQRAADQGNHQIDTPNSYQAIHDLCQNW